MLVWAWHQTAIVNKSKLAAVSFAKIVTNKARIRSSVSRTNATKHLAARKEECLTSLLLGNRARVNGHVERTLVGRNLGRHHSGGNGNKDGGGSHFEVGLADKQIVRGIKLRDIKKGTKTADEQTPRTGAGTRGGRWLQRRRAIMLMLMQMW